MLRILIEKTLSLDLIALLKSALAFYPKDTFKADPTQAILEFCFDRLRFYHQECGVTARVFEAVHAKRLTDPLDFHLRVLAVNEFVKLKEAEALAAANKRVHNESIIS
jgi:glycyl-tRNA synthetase beta chain